MLVYSILALAFAASIRADCPSGSFQIPNENTCVYAQAYALSFNEAYVSCEQLGGIPFGIKTIFENAFLRALIDASFNGQSAFFGVQKGENSTWSYSDGSALEYQNWAQGEPQSRSDLTCAQIDSATAQWRAATCDQRLPYFCQVSFYRNLNTTSTPFVNTTGTPSYNSTNFPSVNSTSTPFANSTNWPSNYTLTPSVNSTSWPSNYTLTPFVNSTSLPLGNSTLTPFVNSTNLPGNGTNFPSVNSTNTYPAYNVTNPIFSNSSVTFPAFNTTDTPPSNWTVTPPIAPNSTATPSNLNTTAQPSTTSYGLERLVGKAFLAGMGLFNH